MSAASLLWQPGEMEMESFLSSVQRCNADHDVVASRWIILVVLRTTGCHSSLLNEHDVCVECER